MPNLISGPDTNVIYARNTVPPIMYSGFSSSDNITAELWITGDNSPLFTGLYKPDFTGRISLSFDDLYKDDVATDFPINGNTVTQYLYIVSFQVVLRLAGTSIATFHFYVANAILNSAKTFASWADQNFLTNQPLEKPTTKDAPEWLTYLDAAQGDRVLKVVFYPKSGGNETVTVYTSPAQGCYTVDVSYKRLVKMSSNLPSGLKGYYDLVLFDAKESEICRQRYICRERTGREKYFCFINALGGIDTLICQGENLLQPELTHNIGRFCQQHIELDDTDNSRKWTQKTGMMPYRWREWIYELMVTKQGEWIYDVDSKSYRRIVIASSEISVGDSGQLASAIFSYMAAEATRAISDGERATDRSLHQSVAEQAEEMVDISEKVVLAFAPVQGHGFETEAIEIPAHRIYVTVSGDITVYVEVNGQVADEINAATDRIPAIIDITPGDEVAFSSQDEIISLTVNYYPDEEYLSTHSQQTEQQQTES